MPYIITTLTLIVVCGLLSALLATLLRFLFRWPWIWALVAGAALVAVSTLLSGSDIWSFLGRFSVDATVAAVSVVMLRRERGWNWPWALAAGIGLLAVLCFLTLPIETHTVRLDMPRQQ